MGRAGKDDLHMRSAPLGALIREAAEPHSQRGVALHMEFAAEAGAPEGQPIVWRKPEIIHGLRNLVQNAVDFSENSVWIDGAWGNGVIRLTIIDDGPGFPTDMLGRLGDPFLRRRSRESSLSRPGYEGMGLGLFIAKTLLERSGARVTFGNASDPFLVQGDVREKGGARVDVIWPHEAIGLLEDEAFGPLGENQPIAV
jgi:two-component system sensor histidine kinase RegB